METDRRRLYSTRDVFSLEVLASLLHWDPSMLAPHYKKLTIGDEDIVHHISAPFYLINTLAHGGCTIVSGRPCGDLGIGPTVVNVERTYTWPAAAILAKLRMMNRPISCYCSCPKIVNNVKCQRN